MQRDLSVCVCVRARTPVTSQWFKDKDLGEISCAALENVLCSQFYPRLSTKPNWLQNASFQIHAYCAIALQLMML